MDSQFKISETLTAEDWEAFNLCMLSRKVNRGLGTAVRMASAVERPNNSFLGILLIAMGVFCLYSITLFPGDETSYPMMGLNAFLGCSFLFFGVRTFRRRKASTFSRTIPQNSLIGKPIDFTFEEDAFFVRAEHDSSSYRYHVISDVWEDKTHFGLFGPNNIRFALRKDAFTQGDPEQFRAFIADKTGKPVEYVE